MRQGQQNNRRGRGRGGRKPQNPLARSYESNGPDVKIRGTATHIAEKYMSLARDALASGDLVAAESYFQHAEHYNRIIMAAQSQHGGGSGDGANGGYRPRWVSDASEEDGGSDAEEGPSTGGGEERASGREHHGPRPNGSEQPSRDANGADSAEPAQSDESATDPVG